MARPSRNLKVKIALIATPGLQLMARGDGHRPRHRNHLRYRLAGRYEEYEEYRRKALPDYEIFMAIAEDIGYDATGRQTKTNELDAIGQELRRFIKAIEQGSFELSETVNRSRVFLVRKADVNHRLDPFYFRPDLVALEQQVRRATSNTL